LPAALAQAEQECPPGQEIAIAEHACLKYSDRVGRSASAKNLEESAIRLAVIAHIRHAETHYDDLLAGRLPWRGWLAPKWRRPSIKCCGAGASQFCPRPNLRSPRNNWY
jgi:hypothetical protein